MQPEMELWIDPLAEAELAAAPRDTRKEFWSRIRSLQAADFAREPQSEQATHGYCIVEGQGFRAAVTSKYGRLFVLGLSLTPRHVQRPSASGPRWPLPAPLVAAQMFAA